MRLMFAAVASHGHIYPLVPLAVAARNAGHEVLFAAGERFHQVLRAAGLEAVRAGTSIREVFHEILPRDVTPEERERLLSEAIGGALPRRWAADMAPLLEAHRPDVVIHEPGALGAGVVSVAAGIPVLRHEFGPVPTNEMCGTIGAAFTAFTAEFEVDAAGFVRDTRFIDICPDSVQSKDVVSRPGRIPLRPVSWSEPGEPPDIVRARDRSRPLVYLTLGTQYGNSGLLRQAVAGIAALPVDVLVACGPKVDLAKLAGVGAENVHLEAWVPQAAVLPHVDLAVHHAGPGTMFGAFAAGVPQLVLPQAVDQFGNAEAVLGAGVGARLLPDEFSREAVTERVRSLLGDEAVRTEARRLADEIATMPSPDDIAALLPSLVQ